MHTKSDSEDLRQGTDFTTLESRISNTEIAVSSVNSGNRVVS